MNQTTEHKLKSAEQYIELWQQRVTELSSIDAGVQWFNEERIKFWQAALNDAIREGMRKAVGIINQTPINYGNNSARTQFKEAILYEVFKLEGGE